MPVPIRELFPLFSPEGEKHWAPGWDYENVMGTTELSEDYVFLTDNHSHSAGRAIWLVKRYLPHSHHVEYYKIEPEEKIGRVSVSLSETENMETVVRVSYRYTAISASGE